ncbi:hypothetical protein LEMLEM_LOCUS19873 [Lemmus lemmus]
MYWFPTKLCFGSDQSPSIIYLSSFPWEASWSSLHPRPDPLALVHGCREFSLFTQFNSQSISPRTASSPPPARAESWEGISANRQWLSNKQRVLEKIGRND